MGRVIVAILCVPVAAAIAVGIGFVVHDSDAFGGVAPLYILVGSVVGIAISLFVGREPLLDGREHKDYIAKMAWRDASAYAFRDLILVILVSVVVFTVSNPSGGLAAYSSSLAAVGVVDWALRRLRLDRSYSGRA